MKVYIPIVTNERYYDRSRAEVLGAYPTAKEALDALKGHYDTMVGQPKEGDIDEVYGAYKPDFSVPWKGHYYGELDNPVAIIAYECNTLTYEMYEVEMEESGDRK